MADAGSEYYHAISGAGANIGKAIQQAVQRHQKQKSDITRDMAVLDRLAQMPDPTDPTGKKMLVDQKKMIALRHLKGAQLQAAAEGEIGAIELGQKIHKAGEPIRNLMSGPKTQTDETGRQWRFNGREWIPMTPQKGQGKAAAVDEPTKALNKSLAPYGMSADDMTNLDTGSLRISDASGNSIPHVRLGDDGKIYQKQKQTSGEKQWLPVSPNEAGAHSVSGKAGGKEFTIPFNNWSKIHQSFQNIFGAAMKVKSDYQAGSISKEEALKRLRAMEMFGGAQTKTKESSPNGASGDESDTEE